MIITVKDFGIGIEKEERSKVLDRFYRTKGRSVLISGFGLGLYICRDIIKRHHGNIWIESEEKGSFFIFHYLYVLQHHKFKRPCAFNYH